MAHFKTFGLQKDGMITFCLTSFRKGWNAKRQFPKDGAMRVVVWYVHGGPLTSFYLTRSPKGNDRSSESQVRGNIVSSVK